MLRKEALEIADQLTPDGFRFNSLALTGEGQWVATFIDDTEPPQAVVERWRDVYTDKDPDPEGDDYNEETETEEEGKE